MIGWNNEIRYLSITNSSKDPVISLLYVVREHSIPSQLGDVVTNQPYSADNDSVHMELVNKISHQHNLFAIDNRYAFNLIDIALVGTSFFAEIEPLGHRTIVEQNSGRAFWHTQLVKAEVTVKHKFMGTQTNYSVARNIDRYRNAFVMMQKAAMHVPFKVSNDSTRVKHFLESITSKDTQLIAGIAYIGSDILIQNDFEAMTAYIIKCCPISRVQANKRKNIEIASAKVRSRDETTAFIKINVKRIRVRIEKSGVHFRWHKPDEYAKLNQAQKEKLKVHRYNSAAAGKSRDLLGYQQRETPRRRRGKQQGSGANISELTMEKIADSISQQENAKAEAQEKATSSMADFLASITSATKQVTSGKDTKSVAVSLTVQSPGIQAIISCVKKP